jgi:hypothetical protein
MMMRKIAIGLAAATVAIGGPTLTASALQSQSMESGIISKGSESPSTKSHRFGPRTYGFYDEERGSGNRFSELTPLQRERLRGMARERFSELTPLQRERLRGMARERLSELTPLQRERLRGMARERFSELTPLQRERLRGIVRERFSELTPVQRERINRFVLGRYERLSPLERERLYRHGAYGRR